MDMPFRRTYERGDAVDPVVTDDAVEERRVTDPTPWSPAQIIGLIVGIGFTVLGIAAVATTGFHTDHIYTPHDTVWRLSHSPLLAVCEIGFGVLMILASVIPGGSRELMALLGAISLAFGIVILTNAAQSNITHWFGVTHANGWLFAIVGGVMLLTALLSPTFFAGGTRHRRRVVTHA
jgi:Domain of unknown function (DUF4383)